MTTAENFTSMLSIKKIMKHILWCLLEFLLCHNNSNEYYMVSEAVLIGNKKDNAFVDFFIWILLSFSFSAFALLSAFVLFFNV